MVESNGRAYLVADSMKGSRIPAIHSSKYDYKDMLPRDSVDSFSFVYIPGRYDFVNFDSSNISQVADVDFDVIFFGDLRKITVDPHEISTSEMIVEAIKKLTELGGLKVLGVEDQNREVYAQFSADIETKYFMWPFCLFRLKLNWYFDTNIC